MRANNTSEHSAEQHFNATFLDRFWSKIFFLTYDRGCWMWAGGSLLGAGKCRYGLIGCGGMRGGVIAAHRASWIIHYGPIPAGAWVLHRCDNTLCVRPDHLFLGDAVVNSRDTVEKRRHAFGEKNPRSKLREDQVREILIRSNHPGFVPQRVATHYGVSCRLIRRIVGGVAWKHVPRIILAHRHPRRS